MGRTNIASGGTELNVFAQLAEPSKKDGIWIKTEGGFDTDNKYTKLTDIPYSFSGNAVAVGTNIYLVGGHYSDNKTYKYNTLTNKYTQLTNIPYSFSGNVVAVGTDIYLLGTTSGNISIGAYKYDTLTDEYTQIEDIPYNFAGGSTVAIGTDIYLVGGTTIGTSYSSIDLYKYDTLTDTYTKLNDIPNPFNHNSSAVAIGTDIYLFNKDRSGAYAYKYDTLTDEYTQITSVPYDFNTISAVAVGTDIYLLSSINVYKYDTLTNKYTKLTDIPYSFSGNAVAVGTDIYLLNRATSTTVSSVIAYKCEITITELYPEINKYKYSNIEIVDSNINDYIQFTNAPYIFSKGSITRINENLYIFGSSSSTNYETAYKYNLITSKSLQLTNIPYNFYWGGAVAIGTDIYLFGGRC